MTTIHVYNYYTTSPIEPTLLLTKVTIIELWSILQTTVNVVSEHIHVCMDIITRD